MSSTWPRPCASSAVAKPGVAFGAAKLFVHFVMVDDVVAVGAARRRLQIGRTIKMADAQVGEVVRDCRGIVEAKAGVQLNTIGSRLA